MATARWLRLLVIGLSTAGLAGGEAEPGTDLNALFAKPVVRGLPGILKKLEAAEMPLFAGAKALPTHVAYAVEGKIVVKPATGALTIESMSEPWLLTFGKAEPLLVILQSPLRSVECGKTWRLLFPGKAGAVITMPLFGGLLADGASKALGARPPAAWDEGIPDPVLQHIRGWARRLRRIPVDVRSAWELTAEGVKITEAFQYEDLEDAWNTPKQTWAALPPAFALTKAMRGIVSVEDGAKDVPYLSTYGPITVVDGKDSISYTIKIPQLQQYLWDKPVWFAGEKDSRTFKVLRETLRAEIDKILEVNEHLAPFRNLGTGSNGNWHWGSPGETIVTLCWTLPFLEPAKAEALKAYIRREFETYSPLKTSYAPVDRGARREFYDVKPIGKGDDTRNLHNIYAVWEYADKVAGEEVGRQLWPEAKKYLAAESQGFFWDAGESPKPLESRGVKWAPSNTRINGYIGYTRLARLAGDKQAEQWGTCLLARALAVRCGQAWYHQYLVQNGVRPGLAHFPPGFLVKDEKFSANLLPLFDPSGLRFDAGLYGEEWPYVFLNDLTPELGQFYGDQCREPVVACAKWIMWKCPGCWLNRGMKIFGSSQGENWVIEPYIPWVNFLVQATVIRELPEELAWYVGDSRARFGDLYYLQRLALALRAFAVAEQK